MPWVIIPWKVVVVVTFDQEYAGPPPRVFQKAVGPVSVDFPVHRSKCLGFLVVVLQLAHMLKKSNVCGRFRLTPFIRGHRVLAEPESSARRVGKGEYSH